MNDHSDRSQQPGGFKRLAPKLIVLGVIGGLFAFVSVYYGDVLTLKDPAAIESQIQAFRAEHPVLIYLLAVLLYVVVTGLSLPGATLMTLAYAWLFGFWRALVIVSFASTAGATLAFILARYLLGNAIQSRFGDRLEKFNEALRREGAFYLLTLRLVPAVPFFVINVVMGLTPLRARTFWWVSQIGMFPGTCVYIFVGTSLPSLTEISESGSGSIVNWQTLAALALLGIFPLATKKVVDQFRR